MAVAAGTMPALTEVLADDQALLVDDVATIKTPSDLSPAPLARDWSRPSSPAMSRSACHPRR